jgi:hypothetical protein
MSGNADSRDRTSTIDFEDSARLLSLTSEQSSKVAFYESELFSRQSPLTTGKGVITIPEKARIIDSETRPH